MRTRPLALLVALLAAAWSPVAAVEGLAETPASKLHFDPFEAPAELAAAPTAEAPAPPPAVRWAPTLRAVMVAGPASMANVDGALVRIGEEIEGHRLVEVTERRAVFERDGVLRELVIE